MKVTKINASTGDWPESRQYKKSIRLDFSLYVSGMILVLMLITGYVITNQYVDTVTRNIVDKLLVQARSSSGPAGKLIISTNGPDALLLNNICKKLAVDNPDVYWAGITNTENTFLAHTDIKQVIAGAAMPQVSIEQYHDLVRSGEAFDLRGDTIYVNVPIRENNVLIGRLGVASSMKQITEVRRSSMIAVGSITVLVVLLGIPLTMVILHRKLRPISTITDHLKNINFDDINLEIPFSSRNELGYLAEMLRVMGAKLNVAQKEMIENERIARELEIAREIQVNILPRAYPHGVGFEFAGAYRSAKEVGGDYYDFIEHDDRHIAFLVADVSGKSLPGMLVMLLTRDIVKRISRTVRQPAELLSEVNRELLSNIKKGMFVTMFYGVLNKDTGRFVFASAGHNPLIVVKGKSGSVDLIKTKGYPLGMMPPEQFNKRIENREVTLEDNDWLIQYTDGVNEAQNGAGEEFGMERFLSQLEACNVMNPAGLVEEVLKNHTVFVGAAEQFDDITLTAMKWSGVNADKYKDIIREDVNVS